LDASALLAFLHREPGSDLVQSKLSGSVMSAVNYAEVLKKLVENGASAEDARQQVDYLPVIVQSFDNAHAFNTASIWPDTKAFGLSLGDRACLALGILTGATVYTADRLMAETRLPVKVRLLRDRN
jgi:PIN domain nuclease of toxin-antitoxin system